VRFSNSKADEPDTYKTTRVDSLLSGASLVNMDAPSNPRFAEECRVHYEEWFLKEVDRGLAEADRGEFADHDAVRKMIDERYCG
jgi:predicted transcriptional regulator